LALDLNFGHATEADAPALAAMHNAAADDLTSRFGHGHWSYVTSERAVLSAMKSSRVLVARRDERVVGSLRLQTKKPWAIDVSYFIAVPRALYLVDMAVAPDLQRQGIGRRLLEQARRIALDHPAQAIRLDAYDHEAGAGEFYAKCGYTEAGRVTYKGTPLIYYELLL
jgi:ribosomal protein S18 acetylase RimI-like enzyme